VFVEADWSARQAITPRILDIVNLTVCSCRENFAEMEADCLFIWCKKFRCRGTAIMFSYCILGGHSFALKEDSMVRTVFVVAIVALALASVSGVSQAAPAAPLPSGVASEAASGNITHVWCRWGRCHHHWHHWCRWHRC
jgi:hypothetical protein